MPPVPDPARFLRPLPRDTRRLLLPAPEDLGSDANLYHFHIKRVKNQDAWVGLALRLPGGVKEPLNPAQFWYRLCPDRDTLGENQRLFLQAWKTMADGWGKQRAAGGNDFSRALLRRRAAATVASLQARGQTCRSLDNATVTWRLIVGMGNPHPLETSLMLHPQYGIPLVPGSAIKGLVRHWCLWRIGGRLGVYPLPYEQWKACKARREGTPLQWLERLLEMDPAAQQEERAAALTNLKQATPPEWQTFPAILPVQRLELSHLTGGDVDGGGNPAAGALLREMRAFRAVFGAGDVKGGVTFLDALPVKWRYVVDIMTPHYGDYYTGDAPPADYLEPTPIPFVALDAGSAFRFDLHAAEAELADLAGNWLPEALQDWGVGAKTNGGYGRLEQVLPAGAPAAPE